MTAGCQAYIIRFNGKGSSGGVIRHGRAILIYYYTIKGRCSSYITTEGKISVLIKHVLKWTVLSCDCWLIYFIFEIIGPNSSLHSVVSFICTWVLQSHSKCLYDRETITTSLDSQGDQEILFNLLC